MKSSSAPGGGSPLELILSRLEGQGPAAHRIWQPPLNEPHTLDQLLPPLRRTPGSGLTAADERRHVSDLTSIAGVVDVPSEQSLRWLGVSMATGHLAIVGGPRTGKSTLVATLVASIALTHTPAEAQFYCLDFGAGPGAVGGLGELPHVGSIASRRQPELVHRTIAELTALADHRRRKIEDAGARTAATWQELRRTPALAPDEYGDVFLVIDNWGALRDVEDGVEDLVADLAGAGFGAGLHLIVTAGSWSEFKPGIRELFRHCLELRLPDPSESQIDPEAAALVPEGRPGRGIVPDGAQFLSALPRIDGNASADDLAQGMRSMVQAVKEAWSGPPAPPIRMLPALLPFDALPADSDRGIPIGIEEEALSPVFLDFVKNPHFAVFGDTECGKSNLLRLLIHGIESRYTAEQARIIIVDYRRSLLDSADTEHHIGYGASKVATQQVLGEVHSALSARFPPVGVTPEQLRDRSWWSGAELFLVVDDYNLVATPSGNPLEQIIELLPQARDIGFHLILARSMVGAGRAIYDPLIRSLDDAASPVLVMSGRRDEGNLFGLDARPLPPGRGVLVDPSAGRRLVQTALFPPPQEQKGP